MKKNIVKVLLLIALYENSFAICTVSSDCEGDLSNMSQNVTQYIANYFNKLYPYIEAVTDEYKNVNTELDKEIEALEITLKGEMMMYDKISNIEDSVKNNVAQKEISSTILILMQQIAKDEEESIQKLEKEIMKNDKFK